MRIANAGCLELGEVFATPGAVRLLREANATPLEYIRRHVTGDWGVLDAEDRASNERALVSGERILSAYMVGDAKIWIITEADRSRTTILTPQES